MRIRLEVLVTEIQAGDNPDAWDEAMELNRQLITEIQSFQAQLRNNPEQEDKPTTRMHAHLDRQITAALAYLQGVHANTTFDYRLWPRAVQSLERSIAATAEAVHQLQLDPDYGR